MARTDTPKSENFDETIPIPGSTRKARDKKDKEKELREREKEREKEKAKEVMIMTLNDIKSSQSEKQACYVCIGIQNSTLFKIVFDRGLINELVVPSS